MAESKGALIAKSMQKHAGRAKEKLLQNLGKVDRTLDDIFEEHLQNFNRQHQQATRLQKEFNNYIRCIRAVQTASKSLMEAVSDVYESGWAGHDLLYVQAQNMEMLWQDFSHKLGDQVLIPLNTYTNQFPETRKKIEKRGRKLVDYDSQRHNFQNLQANAAKRRDDVKVTRGREQLEEARRTYELLNSELHDELPALHDARLSFYVHNLSTLFAAEHTFHAESGKVFNELEAIMDKLATESQRGAYKKPVQSISPIGVTKTMTLPLGPSSPTLNGPHAHNGNGTASHTSTLQTSDSERGESPPATPARAPSRAPNNGHNEPAPPSPGDKPEDIYDIPAVSTTTPESPIPPEKTNGNSLVKDELDATNKDEVDNKVADNKVADNKDSNKEENNESKLPKPDGDYDVPVGATVAGAGGAVGAGVAGAAGAAVGSRVRATYRYVREDADELSFDVGDTIRVVEYDDPDEQEEGWLMGIKESTNEKGMFPANFTRPI